MSEASDNGADFFKTEPELLAAAVWHAAAELYPNDRDTQRDFVNGYITARLRHDEYLREKNPPHESDKKNKEKNLTTKTETEHGKERSAKATAPDSR